MLAVSNAPWAKGNLCKRQLLKFFPSPRLKILAQNFRPMQEMAGPPLPGDHRPSLSPTLNQGSSPVPCHCTLPKSLPEI